MQRENKSLKDEIKGVKKGELDLFEKFSAVKSDNQRISQSYMTLKEEV